MWSQLFWFSCSETYFFHFGRLGRQEADDAWVCVCVFLILRHEFVTFLFVSSLSAGRLAYQSTLCTKEVLFSRTLCQNRCSEHHKPFFFSLPLRTSLLTLSWRQTFIHPLLFFCGCACVSAFLLPLQRWGAAEMPRAVRLAQLYLERNCWNEVVGQHKEVIVIARRRRKEASLFWILLHENVRCLFFLSLNGTRY